jgi:microcystin-dependent protein
MLDYAGTGAVPTGYLLCDGSAISRTTYADLFAAIGTTWGVGDGTTTFNLPDTRRRVSMGKGGSGSSTIGNAVGNTGGEETHTLIEAEMPTHTHTQYGSTATGAIAAGATVVMGGVKLSVSDFLAPGDRVSFGDYNSEMYPLDYPRAKALCDAVQVDHKETDDPLRIVRVQDIRLVEKPVING